MSSTTFVSKSFFCFLVFALALENPAVSQSQAYFPDSLWQIKKPSEVRMNAALLDSAVKFAMRNDNKVETDLRIACLKSYAAEPGYKFFGPFKHRGKPAGVIIKNGYIVAQWGDVSRVDMTFSVTKSYLSTMAGLAYDEKLIRKIDEPVANYVEEKFDGVHNGKITWRHLLTQSSDWSGCLFDFCDWADRPPKQGGIDDWKNRKLVEPGSVFEYNDVRVNLLAYSLLQVWRKPLPVMLKEKIMDPIGASTTWRWHGYENSFVNVDGQMMQSVSGGGHFGGGLFINTLDHARFGLLFARKGRWKNQQLISERWVTAARQPSMANPSYGFMWWTNQQNNLGTNISKNVFYADGFGGNYVVVDQENDLVIVARWLDSRKIGELVQRVTSAIQK